LCHRHLHSFPTRRSSDLPEIDGKLYLTDIELPGGEVTEAGDVARVEIAKTDAYDLIGRVVEILPRPGARSDASVAPMPPVAAARSEEHTSELQSRGHLVC